MSYGITSTGFVIKPTTQIVAELQAAYQKTYGDTINLAPQSNISQEIALMAAPLSDVWQLGQAIYAAFFPDSADGSSLVNVCGITGTIPHAATPSTVAAVLVGTNGTIVPSASVASVAVVRSKFQTSAPATIVTLAAWATNTPYAANALVRNAGNVYLCTTGGTSANAGPGPNTTGAAINDNGVIWEYIAAGSAAVLVTMICQVNGPTYANTNTLTVIETPVAGWASVMNPSAAILGALIETDAVLRVRRENELRKQGNAAIEAIRQKVLAVPQVTQCFVFENETDATDGNGLPPHSIEVLVQNGATQDIVNAIFAAKAAGIATYTSSANSGTVVDSQGISHTINFSRPSVVNFYAVVNLTHDPLIFPIDGVAQVQNALETYESSILTVGQSVIERAMYGPVFGISGVKDVPTIYIGTAPGPVSQANLTATLRQLYVLDITRITVNVT